MNASSIENDDPHVREATKIFEEQGVSQIGKFCMEKLNEWKKEKITIAVTGDSGTGKSSFINAIRGLKDDGRTPNAAKTGVIETTKIPKMYLYPENENIQFWDLPGIGTPERSSPEDYYGEVKFKDYDAYLIFTRSRFTENNRLLAAKVNTLNKPFFLVRTHIDVDIVNESEKVDFNEVETLENIRKYCFKNLKGWITEKDVFLISNKRQEKWEFVSLTQAILRGLTCRKRESLLLSLKAFSKSNDILRQKAELLRERIWKAAIASAAGALIPIPGFSFALDVGIISNEIKLYRRQFGLPDENSTEFERLTSEEQKIFKKFCVSSAMQVGKLMVAYGASVAFEEYARFLPIIGIFLAGSISFGTTYCMLERCLEDMEKTALKYLDTLNRKIEHDIDFK